MQLLVHRPFALARYRLFLLLFLLPILNVISCRLMCLLLAERQRVPSLLTILCHVDFFCLVVYEAEFRLFFRHFN